MSPISFQVYGLPTAQGSKRAFVNKKTGRAHVVENNAAKVGVWREDVKQAALKAMEETGTGMFTGPVSCVVAFYFNRPKSHYRTGRNAHLLRDAAPEVPTGKPDLDKIIRSTFDAITASGLWADDKLVTALIASKNYAGELLPQGAMISIGAFGGREEGGLSVGAGEGISGLRLEDWPTYRG